MRVAYLTSQYPAASHTFIRREVRELRRRGLEVHTFSIRPCHNVEHLSAVDQAEAAATWSVFPLRPLRLGRAHARAMLGHPVAYLRTAKSAVGQRVPGLRGAAWALFHFAEAIDLAAELKRRKVGHLHNHFANSGANVGYLASRFLDIKWSLTLHGVSEFDYPAGVLLPQKLVAADFVACASKFCRAQAMRLVAPTHWAKMPIVRAGIETPQPWAESTGSTAKAPPASARPTETETPRGAHLVCVARLSPEKGHAGLLTAFAQLAADGLPATLELLGAGPEQASIEAQVAELGLKDRVVLRGAVAEQEVWRAMRGATVVVLASFMEGLPVVLMEALALGVPVVAPCVAGIPELVEHGVSGLTFPPGDWNGLAAALRRLLADPPLQRRLAEEGQRRVEAEFLVESSVQPLLDALGEDPQSDRRRHPAPDARSSSRDGLPTSAQAS